MGAVVQLGPSELPALRAHLARDAIQNGYLLGLLAEHGIAPADGGPRFAFFGLKEGERIDAALFIGGEGGLLMPSAADPAAVGTVAAPLRGQVRPSSCAGEGAAVDAVLRALGVGRPSLLRELRLFSVTPDDMGPFTNPTLRLATEEDLPRLLPLAAGALASLTGRDPLASDPEGFRRRVRLRVRSRRTYVLDQAGELVFKVDVGPRSELGAELEGVFTSPSHRQQGHATLSLGQISRQLLSSIPRLSIRIDESVPHFVRIARKVGYLPGKMQRLVLL